MTNGLIIALVLAELSGVRVARWVRLSGQWLRIHGWRSSQASVLGNLTDILHEGIEGLLRTDDLLLTQIRGGT